jgi:tetratricopeptide (TPR) repeat protein
MKDRVRALRRSGALPKGGAFWAALLLAVLPSASCASGAVSAEEYYNLGMAYFDLGKYDEAARWLERARAADRTKQASEYSLGRIAFARQDYEGALVHFEKILKKDPRNILALRAAAYTLIRLERLDEAGEYYGRVLALVPESADNGKSYAILLLALKKPAEAEETLLRFSPVLAGDREYLLLLARARSAQDKVEAIDDYGAWLAGGDDPAVRLEYARVLEKGEFYARALEEYRALLPNAGQSGGISKGDLRFTIGRLLLIADSEGNGIEEIEGAITDGFSDSAALEALLEEPRISEQQKDDLRRIQRTMQEGQDTLQSSQ